MSVITLHIGSGDIAFDTRDFIAISFLDELGGSIDINLVSSGGMNFSADRETFDRCADVIERSVSLILIPDRDKDYTVYVNQEMIRTIHRKWNIITVNVGLPGKKYKAYYEIRELSERSAEDLFQGLVDRVFT